ncbi:MAG: sigma 54-interacting transcriptional regulator [Tissierellaceae bacterium]|nr:sigma 54-interacting transcriptional regulator [Tissierellaceae bacterium]
MNMKTKRIKIITNVDRPHMTYDILSIFRKYDVEIIWMEVYTFVIYIKMPDVSSDLWAKLKEELKEIEGFASVKEISLIAVEERDIEMNRILDDISYGVVILSRDGRIKYTNKYAAEKVFKSKADKVNGADITSFINERDLNSFFERQEDEECINNMQIVIGNRHYIINIHPMLSNENIFSGYMLNISDKKVINEMINANRYENPITFDDIIAESNKMIQTINQAKLFSLSDSPILITGESGTGKELLTRAIHNLSNRRDKPFVAINCASIPEQLLESELFGYEGGAFTGSKKAGKMGLFEVANGGTLFLDEIGEMAPHLQAKLLRVLQEKKIRRIGSNKEEPVDVRIISATNQNLEEMVENDNFRLDLLYRINIFNIHIPALRERREDIPSLIEHFAKLHSDKYGKEIDSISSQAMSKLTQYNWPGNVRELQNVVERAVALAEDKELNLRDIILYQKEDSDDIIVNDSLPKSLENLEKKMIEESLNTNDTIRGAAKDIGITHTMLINRMKKYNIIRDN